MNYLINQNVLQKFIGKTFEKYCCDEFEFSNSVTQFVGLCIGDESVALINEVENVDYFGFDEDIAIFRLEHREHSEFQSALIGHLLVDNKVQLKIKSIKIVNEEQKCFESSVLKYNVWLTRAIIFFLENNEEISFEKDSCPFSEEIIVNRGHNLIEFLSDINDKTKMLNDGADRNFECAREVVEIG